MPDEPAHMITVRPYLPGHGPWFTINTSESPRVVMHTDGGGQVRIFAGERYRPAAGTDDIGCADDVVSFAVAYVERPEEFEREPDHDEQTHRDAWLRHGDAIAAELASMRDDLTGNADR